MLFKFFNHNKAIHDPELQKTLLIPTFQSNIAHVQATEKTHFIFTSLAYQLHQFITHHAQTSYSHERTTRMNKKPQKAAKN